MPIIGVTQNEDADALGNVTVSYTGTVQLPELGFTAVVTVPGGDDWAQRMIDKARIEAENARTVAAATI